MKATNILITGLPGVGKTTLIQKLHGQLAARHPVGFYTREIREGGVRRGFALASFEGHTGVLSHIDIKSKFRVGKYGVDVAGFEEFLRAADLHQPRSDVVIIDEIGKMECYSRLFRAWLEELLNSRKLLVATIARKGGGLIADIKKRRDVVQFELTRRNRDFLAEQVVSCVEQLLAGQENNSAV